MEVNFEYEDEASDTKKFVRNLRRRLPAGTGISISSGGGKISVNLPNKDFAVIVELERKVVGYKPFKLDKDTKILDEKLKEVF